MKTNKPVTDAEKCEFINRFKETLKKSQSKDDQDKSFSAYESNAEREAYLQRIEKSHSEFRSQYQAMVTKCPAIEQVLWYLCDIVTSGGAAHCTQQDVLQFFAKATHISAGAVTEALCTLEKEGWVTPLKDLYLITNPITVEAAIFPESPE